MKTKVKTKVQPKVKAKAKAKANVPVRDKKVRLKGKALSTT